MIWTNHGMIPESGRSPGGRHGNPRQYSCLDNPMDRGAWWATVHRVTKSQTQLKWLTTENLFGPTRHKKPLEGYSKSTSEFRNDLLCMGSSGREYQRNMALCVNQHLLNHPWLWIHRASRSLCRLRNCKPRNREGWVIWLGKADSRSWHSPHRSAWKLSFASLHGQSPC